MLETSLLTLSSGEAANAATKYGFSGDRGVPFQASAVAATGLVEVMRLYSGSRADFQWLADESEISTAVAAGYSVQKTAFYALPAAASDGCSVPVTRMTKGDNHQFVTPSDEAALLADGWSSSGAVFHVLPAGSPPTPPPGDYRVTDVPATGPESDTEFTLAVYPDTQKESDPPSDLRGERRAEWLVANKDARDIRAALSVGDIVLWDTPEHEQFEKASATIEIVEEGGIPWLPVIGNHDSAAVCPGGAACPGDVNAALRDTSTFNSYFPVSRFPWLQGTFESEKVDNAYYAFSAGGVDWLVVALEMWPRPDAVAWANEVVAANPEFNVIVVTHMYVKRNGDLPSGVGGYGDTSPQYLYDNLISKHPNIKLVFGGHDGNTSVHRVDAPSGNTVVSWNNAWHSDTTNPVMLVTVDTSAGTVASATYAPDDDAWLPEGVANQSNMDWVGADPPPPPPTGDSPCVPLDADVYSRYSPTLETSLLTSREAESVNAATKYGFTGDRGTPFQASATAETGLVEVVRLYSSARADFQWLADPSAIDAAIAQGYAVQKTQFHALPDAAADGCSVPVYRMTQGAKHQFVTPGSDEAALLGDGWTNTGAVFHVQPTG